jgi:hypothetical protein
MSELSSQVKYSYKRRHYLVDRSLQLRFMLRLAGSGVLLVLLAGAATFFWGRYLLEKALYSPHLSHAGSGELLRPLLLGFNLVFAVLLFGVIAFLTRSYLQKITGSLLRLEGHLGRMGQGEVPEPLAFRNHDPLQPVGEAFNIFSSGFNQRRDLVRQQIRTAVAALQQALENDPESAAAVVALEDAKKALGKARGALDYK